MLLLASIPSPSSGAIHFGPLQLRAYGLMIALGVIAAVWLTGKRVVERGIGTQEDISAIALWAVPAGIIGARIYHVITDWELFRDNPIKAFAIWEGGLGIWGGIALGVAVGLIVAKRKGMPLLSTMDCVAPALALAQAIGRLGNWWNQELFGRPTTLPWGLEIDPANRPAGYTQYATFHPTFLYEAVWNLGLVAVLLWIDRRHRLRPGRLFVVYVAGYTFARFFVEGLRIDTANKILGLRVNEWTSMIVFLAAAGFLVIDAWRHRGEPAVVVEPAVEAEVDADTEGEVAADTGAEVDADTEGGEPAVDGPEVDGGRPLDPVADAVEPADDEPVEPPDPSGRRPGRRLPN